MSKERFIWDENAGRGYYPVQVGDGQYGAAYWQEYVARADTPIGRALTEARLQLVNRYVGEELVVDVGIGCGTFIERRGFSNTRGYDVNLIGIQWLLDHGVWHDPYYLPPPHACCWDSLEHMHYPEDFVRRVQGYLFVSLPIFRDKEHALASKHFKPNEHYHYFTEMGLLAFMDRLGFAMIETNRMEEAIGREDIGTYVFKRVKPNEHTIPNSYMAAMGLGAGRAGDCGGRIRLDLGHLLALPAMVQTCHEAKP